MAVRSVVCSQMAVRLRQPASLGHGQGQDREQAVAHTPPITRVSHILKNLGQGWHDRTVMVEYDMAA